MHACTTLACIFNACVRLYSSTYITYANYVQLCAIHHGCTRLHVVTACYVQYATAPVTLTLTPTSRISGCNVAEHYVSTFMRFIHSFAFITSYVRKHHSMFSPTSWKLHFHFYHSLHSFFFFWILRAHIVCTSSLQSHLLFFSSFRSNFHSSARKPWKTRIFTKFREKRAKFGLEQGCSMSFLYLLSRQFF